MILYLPPTISLRKIPCQTKKRKIYIYAIWIRVVVYHIVHQRKETYKTYGLFDLNACAEWIVPGICLVLRFSFLLTTNLLQQRRSIQRVGEFWGECESILIVDVCLVLFMCVWECGLDPPWGFLYCMFWLFLHTIMVQQLMMNKYVYIYSIKH